MGEAFQVWLVGKVQSGLPVTASAAISAPPSSPKITRPVAVLSVPPQDSAGPGCGRVQAILPVLISMAFRIRCGFSPVGRRCDPPRYSLPGVHAPGSRLVYTLHFSNVCT